MPISSFNYNNKDLKQFISKQSLKIWDYDKVLQESTLSLVSLAWIKQLIRQAESKAFPVFEAA